MLIDYHLRALSLDTLRQLALDIGWIKTVRDKSGRATISEAVSGCWDEIGIISKPTGLVVQTAYGPIQAREAIANVAGTPYQHVNFRWETACEIDPQDGLPRKWKLLIDRAQACAAANTEAAPRIAAALKDIGLVCITDDGVVARDPKTPSRVFF